MYFYTKFWVTIRITEIKNIMLPQLASLEFLETTSLNVSSVTCHILEVRQFIFR